MKISYNSRILNPQGQKLDRELLGIVHALQINDILFIGSPHAITSSLITNLFHMVLQKKEEHKCS